MVYQAGAYGATMTRAAAEETSWHCRGFGGEGRWWAGGREEGGEDVGNCPRNGVEVPVLWCMLHSVESENVMEDSKIIMERGKVVQNRFS